MRDIIRNIIIKSLRGESSRRQMFNSCRGNARHIETIQFKYSISQYCWTMRVIAQTPHWGHIALIFYMNMRVIRSIYNLKGDEILRNCISSALAVKIYNNNSLSCFLLSSACRKTLLFRKTQADYLRISSNALSKPKRDTELCICEEKFMKASDTVPLQKRFCITEEKLT